MSVTTIGVGKCHIRLIAHVAYEVTAPLNSAPGILGLIAIPVVLERHHDLVQSDQFFFGQTEKEIGRETVSVTLAAWLRTFVGTP